MIQYKIFQLKMDKYVKLNVIQYLKHQNNNMSKVLILHLIHLQIKVILILLELIQHKLKNKIQVRNKKKNNKMILFLVLD